MPTVCAAVKQCHMTYEFHTTLLLPVWTSVARLSRRPSSSKWKLLSGYQGCISIAQRNATMNGGVVILRLET